MATTYEIPSTMHKHVHTSGGRQRGLSHSRKTGPQLTPSQFAAINNGGVTANGSFTIPTPINESPPIYENNRQPASSNNTVRAAPQNPATLQLPKPSSFSTPTMERSKSWERRKSVGLPTHLRLQNNGYGFPVTDNGASVQEAGPQWVSITEIINCLLVPLPCALASLAYGFQVAPRVLQDTTTLQELAGSVLEKTAHPEDRRRAQSLAFALTCALTSGTLLLMGLKGKYTQAFGPSMERRKSHPDMAEALDWRLGTPIVRNIATRILTIGLPLYATSELGIRVALVMLVAMASNLVDRNGAMDGMSGKNLSQLLKGRKYAFGAILLQLLSDLGGFTNYRPPASICLAYVALGISILIFPPPYPSSPSRSAAEPSNASALARSSSAVASIPWATSSTAEATVPYNRFGISPLIQTPADVDLTILSGFIVGVITVLMYSILWSSAGASSASSLAGSILTPCAAVLALTVVDTKSLWTTNGLGVAVGFLTSLFILVVISHEWSVFAYQSVLVALSFAATQLDAHAALSSHAHHDHPHHQHHKPATMGPKDMSRFSAFIFRQIRGWRLLEQIIVEKDSRRIFYFMW